MTPQEINKAIAEYCGVEWREQMIKNGKVFPNYYESLDAMHEAEKKLGSGRVAIYAESLKNILTDQEIVTPFYYHIFILLHATSQQRSEAFLKTIGKWK